MSYPYVGEIRMFGFGRVPSGWQACDGSLMSIAEYEVLYALLGTTYGGDGQTSFGVPDLRGRVPVHQGQVPGQSNYVIGQIAGRETVTLTAGELPPHSHTMLATTAAAITSTPGTGLLPAAVSGDNFYVESPTGNSALAMSPLMVGSGSGGQPHENCMPTLTVQYCIAWAGIFPSQS